MHVLTEHIPSDAMTELLDEWHTDGILKIQETRSHVLDGLANEIESFPRDGPYAREKEQRKALKAVCETFRGPLRFSMGEKLVEAMPSTWPCPNSLDDGTLTKIFSFYEANYLDNDNREWEPMRGSIVRYRDQLVKGVVGEHAGRMQAAFVEYLRWLGQVVERITAPRRAPPCTATA